MCIRDSTPTLSPSRLINLSARANVGSSANILIVGFTISGTGSKQVLLRGIGPTLAAAPFNVPGALANPSLTLLSGSGAVLATDSSWGGTPQLENAFAQSGAFALSATSADSAMINTVSAGSYTSQLSGIGSSEGVGLAEIFDLDSGVPSTSLVNLSARAEVGNGANILIVGFVVSGQQQQKMCIRDRVEHAFIFSNGEISEIGAGTSTQSGAEGINNSGTIVGNANFPPNTWSQAAVYAGNSTWTDLGTVSGGAFSFATAINDSGTIVGQSSIAPNPIYAVPFVCTGAVMTSLGTLDGSMWAIAAEINSSGTIVAVSYTHLDVYKRQATTSTTARRSGKRSAA